MSLIKSARHNPLEALFALSLSAALVSGAALLVLKSRPGFAIPPVPSRYDLRPPVDWRDDPRDVLTVPGYHVAYWGRPMGDKNLVSALASKRVEYGRKVSREAKPYRGVVIHYTRPRPAVQFVKYQHNGDRKRGGSFGYHIYISKEGSIIQGAPLSVRTNHVKRVGHRHRKVGIAKGMDSRNLIGVSAVGACNVAGRAITSICTGWDATAAQEAATIASIKALQDRFDLPCQNVWGHGELQHDRRSYEGTELAERMRAECR
ncbi:MAG: peptidoglycan recognition family protein [Filomicrobium sp.]